MRTTAHTFGLTHTLGKPKCKVGLDVGVLVTSGDLSQLYTRAAAKLTSKLKMEKSSLCLFKNICFYMAVFPTESECNRVGGCSVECECVCVCVCVHLLHQHFIGFESHCPYSNKMLVASMDGNDFLFTCNQ